MTYTEQAEWLYKKYYAELYALTDLRPRVAKICATVAIDLVMEDARDSYDLDGTTYDGSQHEVWWNNVKQELQKL